MDWLVTITSIGKTGLVDEYTTEAMDEQAIARIIMTYRPKRGYRIHKYDVRFNETLFNPFQRI